MRDLRRHREASDRGLGDPARLPAPRSSPDHDEKAPSRGESPPGRLRWHGRRPGHTPFREWSRRRHLAVVLLLLLSLGMSSAACGDARTASDGGAQAPATGSVTPDGPAGDRTGEAPAVEPTGGSMPTAEIWQWALGRSIWDDQALAELAAALGPTSESITMQPDGFALMLDSTGSVTAVLLFNDEAALGLPVSETSYSAYEGVLPAELSWDDTYDTVVGRYGDGALVAGGWGVPYTFAYQTADGHQLELTFSAAHQDELPAAPLHIVTLRASAG